MRLVLQAILAERTHLTTVMLIFRSVLWRFAGRPLLVATAGVGLVFELPIVPTLFVGAVVDIAFGRAAAPESGVVPRLVWLWRTTCRLRRRWPAMFGAVALLEGPMRTFLTPSQLHAGLGGARPILTAPALGLLPRTQGGSTIAWTLTLRPGQTMDDIAKHLDRLAAADRRIRSIGLDYRAASDTQGRLLVMFEPTERRARLLPITRYFAPLLHHETDGALPTTAVRKTSATSARFGDTRRWHGDQNHMVGRHGEAQDRPGPRRARPGFAWSLVIGVIAQIVIALVTVWSGAGIVGLVACAGIGASMTALTVAEILGGGSQSDSDPTRMGG